MAILKCDTCGSVASANFQGDGGMDPDSWFVEDMEFTVSLDANGNALIAVDPNHATSYSKLNTAYWDQMIANYLQQGNIAMFCVCSDEVNYDTSTTQQQSPPGQPQAPAPPPSVAGILGGGSMTSMGLSGSGAAISPPSGGLPDPPAVPSTPEVEDKGTQHAPTVLGLSKEVLERLEKLKNQPLSPSDGFSPPRRSK